MSCLEKLFEFNNLTQLILIYYIAVVIVAVCCWLAKKYKWK